MSSAQGSFVWLIDAENSAELRPVRLAGTVGDRALIAEGLSGGERVVIEGVLKVQPGAKVKPVEPGAAAAAPAAQAAQGEPRQ
jgi:membrane fusion protein (multidrug efflux system)